MLNSLQFSGLKCSTNTALQQLQGQYVLLVNSSSRNYATADIGQVTRVTGYQNKKIVADHLPNQLKSDADDFVDLVHIKRRDGSKALVAAGYFTDKNGKIKRFNPFDLTGKYSKNSLTGYVGRSIIQFENPEGFLTHSKKKSEKKPYVVMSLGANGPRSLTAGIQDLKHICEANIPFTDNAKIIVENKKLFIIKNKKLLEVFNKPVALVFQDNTDRSNPKLKIMLNKVVGVKGGFYNEHLRLPKGTVKSNVQVDLVEVPFGTTLYSVNWGHYTQTDGSVVYANPFDLEGNPQHVNPKRKILYSVVQLNALFNLLQNLQLQGYQKPPLHLVVDANDPDVQKNIKKLEKLGCKVDVTVLGLEDSLE